MMLWPAAVTPEQVAHSDLPVTVLGASALGVSGLGASAAPAKLLHRASARRLIATVMRQFDRFISDSLIGVAIYYHITPRAWNLFLVPIRRHHLLHRAFQI